MLFLTPIVGSKGLLPHQALAANDFPIEQGQGISRLPAWRPGRESAKQRLRPLERIHVDDGLESVFHHDPILFWDCPLVWAAQLLTDCAQTDELPGIPFVAQHDPHRLAGPGNVLPKPAPACPLGAQLPFSGGGRWDLPLVQHMGNVINGIALQPQAEYQLDSLGGGWIDLQLAAVRRRRYGAVL